MTPSYIAAIGGNTPFGSIQPEDVLSNAIRSLSAHGLAVTEVSSLYRTPAFPEGSGPDFANAAFTFESAASPEQILEIFQETEAAFGRERSERWGPRTLDLDLIAHGDDILPDRAEWDRWYRLSSAEQARHAPDRLILPHPRMQDRGFVLIPLCDIAPDWRHPVLRRTVAQMCADLPPEMRQSVVKMADPPCVQGRA